MKDLRPVGLHPGTFAGRQDHGEDRRTLRHLPALLLSLVSSLRAGAAGFEPAIPGPKPGALPLGHAPVSSYARAAAIIPEAPATIRSAKPSDGSASCGPASEKHTVSLRSQVEVVARRVM